jgi:hypothetical protein
MTVAAAIERWFTPEFRAQNPEIIERQMERVLGNDPVSYAAAYRVFAENDVIDDLHKIRCPALVMMGSTTRVRRLRWRRPFMSASPIHVW